MYYKLLRRHRYADSDDKKAEGGISLIIFSLALIFVIITLLFLTASAFLKDISSHIAVSDASDVVIIQINKAISDIMQSGEFDGDHFVSFEKNETGEVNAISSNMARINALSSRILEEAVGATGNNSLTVFIPTGNLTGLGLLMGKGPKIPVEVMVLTSSKVEFLNNIVTAGINQTKHQISLNVIVDIKVLVPWGAETTQVSTEVLIADTVIVGRVPDAYYNVN